MAAKTWCQLCFQGEQHHFHDSGAATTTVERRDGYLCITHQRVVVMSHGGVIEPEQCVPWLHLTRKCEFKRCIVETVE